MEYLNWILGALTLASIAGGLTAAFYGARQKELITILKETNEAYEQRNKQLDEELRRVLKEYEQEVTSLKSRIKILQNIKTPPLEQIIDMIKLYHREVKIALKGK